MKVVRFLKSYRRYDGCVYNVGETAGLPVAEADNIITRGIAVNNEALLTRAAAALKQAIGREPAAASTDATE